MRALRWDERPLLVIAPIALPLVALALKAWGLRRVRTRLEVPSRRRPPMDVATRLATAQRVAWCVQVSAAYGPWPANCLQRSVVLCWQLARRGLEGDMCFGVRRTPDGGGVDFHAWVELDGVVLNDTRDVRSRYSTFTPAGSTGPWSS